MTPNPEDGVQTQSPRVPTTLNKRNNLEPLLNTTAPTAEVDPGTGTVENCLAILPRLCQQ